MIIKKIILDNIRSFEHEEITLNEGSTLLAGDIGSGKTSVLLGIEFGLFGLQPGQRGSIFLRAGEDWGGVKLTFEVQGREIIVERTLKRAKAISQDYAAITIDGQKEEMSVTELKVRVLSILMYPLEFSKKQNLLYKFTVYTPQEEMKQIIMEDTETRLNTLRHVFGVDKYKRIMENISVVKLNIREEKRLYEGVTSNLDSEKKLLEDRQKSLEEKKRGIFDLSEDLLLKIENRKAKEQDKKEVETHRSGKSELTAKLGKAQGLLHSKREIYANNEKSVESLKKEIQEFKMSNFNLEDPQSTEEEILLKKKQKEKFLAINLDINSNIVSLKVKMEEYQNLERKMQSLEVCPTCLQNVDAIYRANVLNKNHNDLSQSSSKVEDLEAEKKTTQDMIKGLEISINLLEKKSTDLRILKMRMDGIVEKEKRMEELRRQNSFFITDIRMLERQVETTKSDLLVLSKYDNIFEDKSKELALAQREERISEIKLAELKKEIEMQEKEIESLELRIKKIEEVQEKMVYLKDIESWLNTKFIPLISFVEKNVMVNLKHEFSKLFSEWFTTLVPEGLTARLGDDFTPLIEQKDYEIDYAYLSGGERTAIALAYRLALNQVINSLMSKIQTKDLVILDEPTDGFSSQQLDKMREVLDELDVKQLIIVSHEQKMEGFVENVIKFKKEYGVSRKI
ncbi:MAG: hypothetical protein PF542_01795 [Nanoarchaeota archaeon]|jgi:exonuclease SbcC|nr:hypothetical protein [Nanoarchaeota archaeon]